MKKLIFLLILILSPLSFTLADAPPGSPHQFYGTVVCQNGINAPDNTGVEARNINSTKNFNNVVISGQYGVSSSFVVEANFTPNRNYLDFYVGGIFDKTYIVTDEGPTNLPLILHQDCTVPQSGNGGSSGGGGGGGSRGGLGGFGGCIENWVCNDFTPCVDGIQTRQCADLSKCGAVTTRSETIYCEEGKEEIIIPATLFESLQQQKATRFYIYFLAVGIIIVAAAIVVVVEIIRKKELRKRGIAKQNPGQVDFLRRYIEIALKQGFNKQQIKQSSLNKGWPPALIDEALASFK